MTDQDFLSRGFKQYPPTPHLDSDGIETHFQKRYDDEIGKRYFITINKWMQWEHPYTREVFGPSYEYSVQLYKKDGRRDAKAVDFLFHNTWTINEVEEYMQKLFETGLFEYYEKWEDC
jgi:hypothetical protein